MTVPTTTGAFGAFAKQLASNIGEAVVSGLAKSNEEGATRTLGVVIGERATEQVTKATTAVTSRLPDKVQGPAGEALRAGAAMGTSTLGSLLARWSTTNIDNPVVREAAEALGEATNGTGGGMAAGQVGDIADDVAAKILD